MYKTNLKMFWKLPKITPENVLPCENNSKDQESGVFGRKLRMRIFFDTVTCLC